ncbi:hypothetical protein Mapa_011992 [Marchantia paleacea]|nr:hypothetical protein Mapa_011992 [Marchantia paleacea]
MGVAPTYLQFAPGSINSLHSHPRGSEIFYVIEGELEAGVIDTANQLYTATLKQGSICVFPKGLVHYQVNKSKTKLSTVIAVFNSESAGRLTIPPATFSTDPPIPTDVLMQAFSLDAATTEKLKRTKFQGAGR